MRRTNFLIEKYYSQHLKHLVDDHGSQEDEYCYWVEKRYLPIFEAIYIQSAFSEKTKLSLESLHYRKESSFLSCTM